jgi:glycosyltransferase involved in cell wall biosynthesis
MPSFSILMANYNNDLFIGEAIESVLAQTFLDWELVIVDDGSSDDSLARIDKYLSDNRIRLYVKKRNEGVTAAQIYGLSKVSSPIVGILDSDDVLMPEAIEKVISIYSEHADVGVVLTSLAMCDSELKNIVYYQQTDSLDLKKPLTWQGRSASFRSFRLSSYRKTSGLDMRFDRSQDWDLLFKLEEVAAIYFLEEPLYLQRQRVSSQSQGFINEQRARVNFACAFYEAYLRRRKKTLVSNVPRLAVSAWLVTATRLSLELGRRMDALYFALRALKIAPLSASSFRVLGQTILHTLCGSRTAFGPVLCQSPQRKFLPVRTFLGGFRSNVGNVEADCIVCIPLIHERGHALYGGEGGIWQSGCYRATFELKLKVYSFSRDPIVVVDVYENRQMKSVLNQREIYAAEVRGGVSLISLDFEAREGFNVEFRVYWNGECLLHIFGVIVQFLTADCRLSAQLSAAGAADIRALGSPPRAILD